MSDKEKLAYFLRLLDDNFTLKTYAGIELTYEELHYLTEKLAKEIEYRERVQELEEIEQEYVDLNNDFTNMALERKCYREVLTELRDFVKRGENECNIKQLIMKKTNGILEDEKWVKNGWKR